MIFEHNPVNPVTRYIVATCEFDENAVLRSRQASLKAREAAAGFSGIPSGLYRLFSGRLAVALRGLEPYLSALPHRSAKSITIF